MPDCQKVGYVAENSAKSLLRTPGISSSGLLVFILGVITYCGGNGFYLLSRWYQEAAARTAAANADTPASLIQLVQTPLIPIRLLQVVALLVTLCAGVLLIAYCHRTFRLFAMTQLADFRTMSLLGESTEIISVEFTLQSIYLISGSLIGSSLCANLLYWFVLAPEACQKAFGTLPVLLWRMLPGHLLFFLLVAGYLSLRLFWHVRRYLWSWFDNLCTEL